MGLLFVLAHLGHAISFILPCHRKINMPAYDKLKSRNCHVKSKLGANNLHSNISLLLILVFDNSMNSTLSFVVVLVNFCWVFVDNSNISACRRQSRRKDGKHGVLKKK